MVPLHRVLVATDLSERAGFAVRRAAQVAAQHGARMTALYVAPAGVTPDLTEFARGWLRAHADAYAPAAGAETVVRSGRTGPSIVAEAADSAADLVVVGAHGAHWLAGPILGSTADNVVRASTVPVLVVRNPPRDAYRTVLLAVNASDTAFAVAKVGSDLTPDAHHVLVHVSVVVGEHLMLMHGTDDAGLEELRRVSTEHVRPRIEEMAASLTPTPTKTLIESGRPQVVLPEVAARHGADLIVVGRGTRSKLDHALLGSVTQHVLRRAQPDVLVTAAE